jgi:hypothetical protein
VSAPKPITEHLADLLRERSARGLAKYGTSIDRGDLNRAECLQHLLEELLDAAQYVEAAKRQAVAPQPQAEPVVEWAMVERAAIVGICRILERDGDEHGAAAELRQLLRAAPQPQAEPVAWRYRINGVHVAWSDVMPPDDAYDVGTLQPLYAAPQPQASARASAEDLALVHEFVAHFAYRQIEEAWQRIRASLEVGRG